MITCRQLSPASKAPRCGLAGEFSAAVFDVFQGKYMAIDLSEDEMRKALFGAAEEQALPRPKPPSTDPTPPSAPIPPPRVKKSSGYHSTRLRVTLHVSREYEGDINVFVHDSTSLSSLIAEQEAKAGARKKKYKYLEVVSIEPVSS